MNKYFYYGLRDDKDLSPQEFLIMFNDYEELIDVLGLLTNEIYASKIKEDNNWRYYIETLSIKFIYHSLNLISALKGTDHKSKILNIDSKVFDLATAYTIKRVLLENYLIFNYLFVQPKSIEEQRFRWLVYEIGGYHSRQSYSVILPVHKEKIQSEKKIIEKLTEELKRNVHFLKLEENRRKSLLKDKPAKIFGWKKIAADSEINENIFIREWALYSNYAHSEFLSLMQMKDYYSNRELLFKTRSHLLFSIIILSAAYITDIIITYSQIKNKYETLTEQQKDCISFLSGIAKNKFEI